MHLLSAGIFNQNLRSFNIGRYLFHHIQRAKTVYFSDEVFYLFNAFRMTLHNKSVCQAENGLIMVLKMVNELKNLTMKLSLAYNWPYILKNTLERAFFVHQISLEGRIVHKFIVSTTQMDEEITMYTVSYSLSLCQLRIITLLALSEQ